jgi:carboxymethylenebutenolidase
MSNARALLCAMVLGVAAHADSQPARQPETVVVPSGSLELRALLWRPEGRGNSPAVLFNHGSGHSAGDSASAPDHRHPELLGPVFARHGYVFLYLYRRGDGLSRGHGVPSGDRMDRALAAAGPAARNQIQLQLLEGDEMNDEIAGLAYLRTLPSVDPNRIAVVGHSFGGSLTVLAAERDNGVRAIVAFAAAGYSWDRSPALRARLITAVDRMSAPAFFIHAENDYTTDSGRGLAAEMERVGKPHRLMIYPPVGTTVDEGHDFVHLMIPMWEADVFAFLDRYLKTSHPKRNR